MKNKLTRAHIAAKLIELFMENLYAARRKKQLEKMAEIAVKNGIALGTHACFFFRGELYTSPPNAQIGRGANRQLLPQFNEEAHEIMREPTFEEQMVLDSIEHYVREVLAHAPTYRDVRVLLPAMTGDIKPPPEEIFNTGPCMSECELEAFKEKHKDIRDAIHTLYMMQLILEE